VVPLREALTILDEISNLSYNLFPPQSMILAGRSGAAAMIMTVSRDFHIGFMRHNFFRCEGCG